MTLFINILIFIALFCIMYNCITYKDNEYIKKIFRVENIFLSLYISGILFIIIQILIRIFKT
jgi:hypothetical protein